MDTHLNDIKIFDGSRTNDDAWMFNKASNLKNENCDAHHLWFKSGKTPTVYMQKKYKEVHILSKDISDDRIDQDELELEWEDLIIQRLVQITDT